MVAIPGIDYSFGRPDLDVVVAEGYQFVLRYAPYIGDQGKGLTAPELLAIQSRGLGLAVVFESTAGRMFDGYPAGYIDAQTAAIGLTRLGYPIHMPIYFACDVDTTPPQLAYVDDYMRGVQRFFEDTAQAGRDGIYGEYDVILHCLRQGTAHYSWQTYAWSNGQLYAGYNLYQHKNGVIVGGAEVDLNMSRSREGLWFPNEEDEMTPEMENHIIGTWCTNQEIRDLRAGVITRDQALAVANSRTASLVAPETPEEPMTISDTLYSHIAAPHAGPGGLVPHIHPIDSQSGPPTPT